MKIKIKIITPERILYEGEANQITLPAKTGEITILPNHVPLVASLQAGELVIKSEKEVIPMAISGGFLEVRPKSEVVILADTAEKVDEINIKRAEEARQRAQEFLKEKQMDARTYAALTAKIEKELARLKVARKHRRQSGPIPQSGGG